MKLRLIRRDQVADVEPLPEDATDTSTDAEPAPIAGPDLLSDGPLLSSWFIVYELEKEMQRARRHERHLSILVLTPVPSLGDRPSAEALQAAAEAGRASARGTDLIGWLAGDRILVILPETDRDGAAAATHRWRTEMYTRTLPIGALRWVVTTSVDPFAYENAAELLNALTASVV